VEQPDTFRQIFAAIISHLIDEGRVDLEECFVDATFAAANGVAVGLARKGKGTKLQLIVDGKGVPLALSIDSANVGETAINEFIRHEVHGSAMTMSLCHW